MTSLMTVQLHTAAIKDFNPEPAIHLWNKTPRRPLHMEQMDMRIEQDNQSDNDSESSMYQGLALAGQQETGVVCLAWFNG